MEKSCEGKSNEEESFVVSKRSYETILKTCHLEEQDIRNLPENAVIVEIGSGEFQEFAHGVKSRRTDVKTISIDPTLSLDPKREDISVLESGDRKTYYVGNPLGRKSRADILHYKGIQEKRRREADEGALAAVAPFIPLLTESVDLWLDSYGPVLYLKKEQFAAYIKEIVRVLKPSGRAQLFPIGWTTSPVSFADKKEFERVATSELSEILQKVEGAEVEPFFDMDGFGVQIRRNVFDQQVGEAPKIGDE